MQTSKSHFKVYNLKSFKLTDISGNEPQLFVAIFIAKPIPFVEEFFELFKKLDYPKSRTNVLIYNNQKLHEHLVGGLKIIFLGDNLGERIYR